jgi:hypothetical protein
MSFNLSKIVSQVATSSPNVRGGNLNTQMSQLSVRPGSSLRQSVSRCYFLASTTAASEFHSC